MSAVDRVVRAGLLISGARVVFDFSLESIAFDFFIGDQYAVCGRSALGEPSAHLGESEGTGLLVLAEEFGGTADGDCGSRAIMVKRCRRQGSRGANSKAAARPGR